MELLHDGSTINELLSRMNNYKLIMEHNFNKI